MHELLPIEQTLPSLVATTATADDVDDLDEDVDLQLVFELTEDGFTEWLDSPERHADRSWGDVEDPYWELGDGD